MVSVIEIFDEPQILRSHRIIVIRRRAVAREQQLALLVVERRIEQGVRHRVDHESGLHHLLSGTVAWFAALIFGESLGDSPEFVPRFRNIGIGETCVTPDFLIVVNVPGVYDRIDVFHRAILHMH